MSIKYTLPSGNASIDSFEAVHTNDVGKDKANLELLIEAMQELAKLTAQPKLDLPWDKIADGTATGIVLSDGSTRPTKDGWIWIDGTWVEDVTPQNNKLIATRPTPKLSDELRKELEAFSGKTVDEVLGGEL